jgi:hypothetical protein
MLTDLFYIQLAAMLKAESQSWGPLYMAIGSGAAGWDRTPPLLRRETTSLTAELTRKFVDAANIQYLNTDGVVTRTPSPQLRLQATFLPQEGSGPVRECGLFIGEGRESVLLAYFIHPRVEKSPESSIDRSIQLDLRPGRTTARDIPTQFLGNSKTQELHNVDNEQTLCQLNEIRLDRRHYFNSIDEALLIGYDHCAYCFGRELSQR